jgi:Ankyrin repeats (many copies)
MKVTCRANALVHEKSSAIPVPAPRSLDGWTYEDDRLEAYLDDEVIDQGVIGGVIRTVVTPAGVAYILIDFWAPAILDDRIVELLRQDVTGQLSDGIGEWGFDITSHGGQWVLMPDLVQSVEVVQFEDGKPVPVPSRVAMFAWKGDLASLSDALASGNEGVDSLRGGYSGLHLAILGGYVDAALMLISHGADPNRTDPTGNSPLHLCASARELSDEDSARLATALLARGANPSSVDREGLLPRELAELRSKSKLAEVLPAPA